MQQQLNLLIILPGLENDLRFALDGQSGTDIRRSLCYVYKTGKKAGQRKKGNEPHSEHQAQLFRLSQLCDNFLPTLVRTHQALIYTSTNNNSECDGKQSYAEELSHQLYSDLSSLIDHSIMKKRDQIHDSVSQQRNLCHILSTLYRIERAEVSHIRAYLEQDTKYPFILIGGPCTGKSVLLAHCATQVFFQKYGFKLCRFCTVWSVPTYSIIDIIFSFRFKRG